MVSLWIAATVAFSAKSIALHDPVAPSLSVSTPFTLASHEALNSSGFEHPDASLYAVRKTNGEYTFWGGSRSQSADRTVLWSAIGSKGGRLEATELLFPTVSVDGYPCPEGYSDPCLLDHKQETNVGMWPANVYRISDDEILMFIHLEFRYHGKWSVRHGLAYSKDGGNKFDWCGYVAAPMGDAGSSVKGETQSPNMGLANYIIKDGYFQLYYHDDVTPGKHSATDDNQQVAVARAVVADVVDFARRLKAAPWFKYYNGTWQEPALGGGRFTPLNLKPQGYMHGDAIYVAPIDRYAIVAQSGDRKDHADEWHKKLFLAFSSDGLEWSDWQEVYTDGHKDHTFYPSLMSYGHDNEVAGETFAVAFQYKGNYTDKPWEWSAVNVTVSFGSVLV